MRWLVVLLVLGGCNLDGDSVKSRWAMSDPKYAQQYSTPYQSNTLKKIARMSQELVDARFEEGKAGFYASGGASGKHRPAVGGEVGVFKLPTSWSTLRLGLVGMAVDGLPSYLVGGVAGARVHLPTRFSPYAGVSGMAGYAQQTSVTTSQTVDNNGNIVPAGTTTYGPSASLAAIVPEAGLSYWLTPYARLSVGTSYYVTSEGHDKDFLFTGIGFEYIPVDMREGTYEPPKPDANDSHPADVSEPYFQSGKQPRYLRLIESTGLRHEIYDEPWENSPNSEPAPPPAPRPMEESTQSDTIWDDPDTGRRR